jgi:hypothetical protein
MAGNPGFWLWHWISPFASLFYSGHGKCFILFAPGVCRIYRVVPAGKPGRHRVRRGSFHALFDASRTQDGGGENRGVLFSDLHDHAARGQLAFQIIRHFTTRGANRRRHFDLPDRLGVAFLE